MPRPLGYVAASLFCLLALPGCQVGDVRVKNAPVGTDLRVLVDFDPGYVYREPYFWLHGQQPSLGLLNPSASYQLVIRDSGGEEVVCAELRGKAGDILPVDLRLPPQRIAVYLRRVYGSSVVEPPPVPVDLGDAPSQVLYLHYGVIGRQGGGEDPRITCSLGPATTVR